MGTFQKVNHLAFSDANMFERMLAMLFPVKLPKLTQTRPEIVVFDEQGECGRAQIRPYRDALDRIRQTGRV